MARGRIFKRQGGYGYRVDLGPDPSTGRRRQQHRQGFRTKREAEAALDERLNSLRSGDSISPSAATLEEFLGEWLLGQRARLKETTWESYRVVVERVNDRIGKVKLSAVTPIELERFHRLLGESLPRPGSQTTDSSVCTCYSRPRGCGAVRCLGWVGATSTSTERNSTSSRP
ncbi:MAG: hypothetical protein GY698_18425 [Actinomycetia bacterium]|nr:hypothetical protein [Actinomycetes bacterium]